MACAGNSEHICYKSCAEARRGISRPSLLELSALLVVVLSQVLQLFVSPSTVLLAMGTIPCTLLWRRPLVALLLVCISIAVHLMSSGIFFRVLARETAKGPPKSGRRREPCKGGGRKGARKGARRHAKHLYAPQGTIVDLVGEGLDDAGAEACARKELGEKDVDITSNPGTGGKIYSTRDVNAPQGQTCTAGGCYKKSGDIFSRRSSNNKQNLYRIRGNAQHRADIDREMHVAEGVMEETLTAFPDT